MLLSSHPPRIRRARPLLGTYVTVDVGAASGTDAHAAIDAAFAEIALLHRLMSFHAFDSDVSRLNRSAWHRPVAVDTRTADVLRWAREIAEASKGHFDVTVAPQLVAARLLPWPDDACFPDANACWRDIEVTADGDVRFQRPLWIDLGGIAKGYAVDCAVAALAERGIERGCVNAGGDLRVIGTREPIALRSNMTHTVAVLEIEDASVASSSGRDFSARVPHLDGQRRQPVGHDCFVSVVAERCVVADALTKVVLAAGAGSHALLRAYRATAYLQNAVGAWQRIGLEAAA